MNQIPKYDKILIKQWDDLTKLKNWGERKKLLPDIEKGIREFLAYTNVDYDEQTKIWDNPAPGQWKTPWGTRYSLSYGFIYEKVVKEILQSNSIKCGFGNGSRKNKISNDSKKMKCFDIMMQALKLSAGADVKSCTLWRTPTIAGRWVVNSGLNVHKLFEIKEWSQKNKKRALLIICLPEADGDILDRIVVINVGKLVDKEGFPILDTGYLTMNPQRFNQDYYDVDSILVNTQPDGDIIISLRDFVNIYGNNKEAI